MKIDNVRQMLEFYAENTSGKQRDCYRAKLDALCDVKVVKLANVLSEDEIVALRKSVRPEVKQCYKNASLVCISLGGSGHKVEYVEGYLNLYGLPIEHAFNRIDGQYVDITRELALESELDDECMAYFHCTPKELYKVIYENEFYGNVFESTFLKEKI